MSGPAAQDGRLLPFNGRVAHVSLRGKVQAARFVEGTPRSIAAPLADLWRDESGSSRQRQLPFGEGFLLLEERGARAFGVSSRDGHVGWIDRASLGEPIAPTHVIASRGSQLYPAPDIKIPEITWLPFASRLQIEGPSEHPRFMRTGDGHHVPAAHLRALDAPRRDPAAIAEQFLGAPYLWGGNSERGIDCSGLVQAALLACARPCPPDSDLQMQALGTPIGPDTPPRRGDLIFWKGHVAMMLDGETLIHASAHFMQVARENRAEAIARIEAAGDGAPIAFRRL